MTLRIHNTLTRATERFTPIEPGHVRLYVCGITIYDLCHMGHARFMLAFDVAQRWLKTIGYRVTYVRNITDIDDKIIRRALERGISIRALTEEMIEALQQDADALGLERPTHQPRATEYVPQMLEMIATLEEKGLGYRSSNGDVNFAVRKFPGYGKLSGKSIDQLRAGERVAVLDGKEDPLDFVMWKSAKDERARRRQVAERRTASAGRAGTSSARRCARRCSASTSTSTAAARTCSSRTTRTRSRRARARAAARSPTSGCTTASSTSTTRRCRSRSATSSPSATCSKRYDGETIRFFMLRTHYRSPFNFSDAEPRRRAQRAAPPLHRARRGRRSTVTARGRLERAARRRVPRGDERRLQHADRGVGAVRARGRGEPRAASPPTRALLKGAGRDARRAAAGAARLPAGRRRRSTRTASPSASRRAPRPSARATSRAPTRSATSSPALGIVLKDSAQGTTWVKG